MNRREYRRKWLLYFSRYERIGLRIFRKGIKQALSSINFDNLEQYTYPTLISLNTKDLTQTYIDFYYTIGLAHGKRVGKSINRDDVLKNFDPNDFEGGYREFIARWLINNAGTRITSVRKELIDYLINYIADGMRDGKDIRTISRELQKHVLLRGFYRWQIERIVRTETTAAANQGAIRAGESSNIIWEKEWISSRDGRTRRRPDDAFDHYEIDGMRVPKGEKFKFQGDALDYPGDPKGQPGNVINCRCTVAIVPKRDENGRIIFTNRQAVFNN